MPAAAAGTGLKRCYTLQQKDIPIWLRTALTELVTEQGRVVGARVSRDGQLVSIRARYGVMIAAGGFDHNAMMRERHFPNAPKDWTQGRYSLGSPGNTGDGIRAGSAAGAALDLMDDMWWMPSSVVPGAPAPSSHVFDRGLPHVIMVNKGDSAFDRYAGNPAHAPNPCLGALGEAPFCAMEISAGDLRTKGGLLTNEHAQVLRTDGSVIEGLYAAGNSSACVMGNFYPEGGGTIGAGMTYAYVAAKHMARS